MCGRWVEEGFDLRGLRAACLRAEEVGDEKRSLFTLCLVTTEMD